MTEMGVSSHSEEREEAATRIGLPLFCITLMVAVILGHIQHVRNFRFATEGSLALLIGLLAGGSVLLYYQVADVKHGQAMHITQDLLSFDKHFFFDILLPPIMFNAGFQIKKKLFFRNFFTLALLGIVGTFVSAVCIITACNAASGFLGGLDVKREDIMALGVIFASTDSIAALQILDPGAVPVLYSLVFGEGVINDATAIVLLHAIKENTSKKGNVLPFGLSYKLGALLGPGSDAASEDSAPAQEWSAGAADAMMTSQQHADAMMLSQQHAHGSPDPSPEGGGGMVVLVVNFAYLLSASLVLGVVTGLGSAFVTKQLFRSSHATNKEVVFVILTAYLTWLLAEPFGFSGIFAIFFCGITVSHYTWHNLSSSARVITVHAFRIASATSEIFLFIYCGFDMWSAAFWKSPIYERSWMYTRVAALACALLVGITLSRALFVTVIVGLSNVWRTARDRIDWRSAAVIWWAGIGRGAITIALTYATFLGRSHKLEHYIILGASMTVVVLITIGTGAVNSLVVDALLPPAAKCDECATPSADRPRPGEGPVTAGYQGGAHQVKGVLGAWKAFDRGVLQPCFGGRHGNRRVQQIVSPHATHLPNTPALATQDMVNLHSTSAAATPTRPRSPGSRLSDVALHAHNAPSSGANSNPNPNSHRRLGWTDDRSMRQPLLGVAQDEESGITPHNSVASTTPYASVVGVPPQLPRVRSNENSPEASPNSHERVLFDGTTGAFADAPTSDVGAWESADRAVAEGHTIDPGN